jgi:hypothetical protein
VRNQARKLCSLIVGIIAAVLTVGLEIRHVGENGLKMMLMAPYGGILAAGVGIWLAIIVGALTALFIYGAIWFVQEAFGLQPPSSAR